MTVSGTLSLAAAAQPVWDAIVIGAGPAGSVAAHLLACSGMSILLVERQTFPRAKVCGGCLNGRAISLLNSLGLEKVLAKVEPVPLNRFVLQARHRVVELELPAGVAVQRSVFDAELVQCSLEAGVEFLPDTAATVEDIAGSQDEYRTVQLQQHGGPSQTARGRIVLAADGLGHPSLQRLAAFSCNIEAHSKVGLGMTFDDCPETYALGTIYMAIARDGYVGLVRTAGGGVNVAAAIERTALRSADSPHAAVGEILRSAGFPPLPLSTMYGWRGTLPLSRHSRRLAGSRVFLLGDAAGYVEPFTGEGMGWALASAVSVVPWAIRSANSWDERSARHWERSQRRGMRQGHVVCQLVAGLLRRPALAGFALNALAVLPSIAGPLVRRVTAGSLHLQSSQL